MTALVLLAVVSVGSWGARCDGERDDTVALPGAYWDRICKMYGKGIG